MKVLAPVFALLGGLLSSTVGAHAMNSAHWRLVQVDAQHWDSRLRLPEDAEGRLLTLSPQWPAGCVQVQAPAAQPADEGSVLRWRMRCPEGLSGALGLSGFSLPLPDAVLEWRPLRGPSEYAVLSRQQPEWTPGQRPEAPPASHYLGLGVHHILLGPDHLLFVLGLWWLWRRSGARTLQLAGTVTAFTVAHSLTLAAAAVGGWSLSGAVVEACIAASILLLAVEVATGGQSLASRQPGVIAFAFGLLHGFGFAGALAETGLPEHARLWALLGFNVGIELGQLAFVAALIVISRALQPAVRWAPLALFAYGTVAAYWTIERSAEVLAL